MATRSVRLSGGLDSCTDRVRTVTRVVISRSCDPQKQGDITGLGAEIGGTRLFELGPGDGILLKNTTDTEMKSRSPRETIRTSVELSGNLELSTV
ncbi:Ion-translocating oxidoreductase complex subunit E [Clarias magur]|uniref:Ion-translocating oxidoreductase complex subunit E n=1 Tax=Clarias magur TaxID=1594786 RepID=A0A8J4U7F2_CLAMG|nr:Ion-translocating oxidoreductase complex subunit E [Clarias magur]